MMMGAIIPPYQGREQGQSLPGPAVNYGGLLSRVFSAVSSDYDAADPAQSVCMPARLYDYCWQLHELSYLLVLSLEHVFKNQEHALIISEGYDLGYRMPNVRQWHDEVAAFKDFLHEFTPYKTRPDGREFVVISAKQGGYLHSLVHYADFMVNRVFRDMFETDYLKPFRNHREAGYRYKGAHVGQQVAECYTGLQRLKKQVAKHEAMNRQALALFARPAAGQRDGHILSSDLA